MTVAYDKFGDGCAIDFPVRLESKIRWSPKAFNADCTVKPRIFSEIICGGMSSIATFCTGISSDILEYSGHPRTS